MKRDIPNSSFSELYAYSVVIGLSAHVEEFDEELSAFEQFCEENQYTKIRFTFPSFLYDEDAFNVLSIDQRILPRGIQIA